MKLSEDMLFAHPVLSSNSTDFRDSLFKAEFTRTIGDRDNLDITATITLNCPDLCALLDSGIAGCGFYLICSRTYQNRLIEMPPGKKAHRFKASDFFGTIRLRPVVWSKQERMAWKSTCLHPEYGGAADFPSASILAVGDESIFSIDRERLKPFETIFNLAALDTLAPGEIAVDTEGEKITINVHPKTKESIEGIRNSKAGRNILLNAVYLPALMQVLHEVAINPDGYESKAWFRIFDAKCAQAGVNVQAPDFLKDSQKLLNIPFLKIEDEKERLFV